jgi:polysaccharide export outer membrane protein
LDGAVDSQKPPYLIGPEDVLEISVWKNAELSKIVIVRPDGVISLPLIGDVKAAGLTPSQLREQIIERLREYQETVVVSVIVQEVNSYRIFILGEVNRPGPYLLKTRTTLLQAIALAGGFNQFASKNRIVVIRAKGKDSKGVEKRVIRFDDIVYKDKQGDKNLILKPGDTIFVP